MVISISDLTVEQKAVLGVMVNEKRYSGNEVEPKTIAEHLPADLRCNCSEVMEQLEEDFLASEPTRYSSGYCIQKTPENSEVLSHIEEDPWAFVQNLRQSEN